MRLPKSPFLLLALLFAHGGVQADAPKNLAIDKSPPLVSNWIPPLDSIRVELVNPFSTPGMTIGPKPIQNLTPPDSSEEKTRAWFAIDIDQTGRVVAAAPLIFPGCPSNQAKCEGITVAGREIATFRIDPGEAGGVKTGTRVGLGIDFTWELDDVVTKLGFGLIDADTLPPQVRVPPLTLEALAADPELRSLLDNPLPTGFRPLEELDRPPAIRGKSIDVRSRRFPLAGVLLAHVTAAGTVDRVLPSNVEPPIFWPYWKRVISGWRFVPARTESGPVDCWVQLVVEKGEATITAESVSQVAGRALPRTADSTPKP